MSAAAGRGCRILRCCWGGGWGPINTPVLLSQRGLTPRKIIGTVDTSEFFIAVSASVGFLIFLGWSQLNWALIGAFVIGGVIAAPIAAYLVRIVPAHLLGVLVGGFIILTNARTLLSTIHVPEEWSVVIHLAILAFWAGAIVVTVKKAGSGSRGEPKTA
nr:sulfite exporter TauE/SafE family protein [Sinobaca sp. H24]